VKILAVSDNVDDLLYTSNLKEIIPNVDLIFGCGDMPFAYLEFLVSIYNVPLLYVPGNHDPVYLPKTPSSHAQGCENIDGCVVDVKGLRVAGLGGSILYKPNAINQYTQAQMWKKAVVLALKIAWKNWKDKRMLDIFIAHSPPLGINDDDDNAHMGFSAFLWLIKIFKPRYFLHGHTLNFRVNLDPNPSIKETAIVNINPKRIMEVVKNVY
jgi:Icc-related predicted phosphoesterase